MEDGGREGPREVVGSMSETVEVPVREDFVSWLGMLAATKDDEEQALAVTYLCTLAEKAWQGFSEDDQESILEEVLDTMEERG